MDDTQKQNQNYTSDGAVTNAAPVQNTPAIGSVHREIERPVTNYVKPSETAPVIEQELKEIGVAETPQKPNLDDTNRQIGVKHAAEFTPLNPNAGKSVVFPLTDEEIAKIEKGDDSQSSAYWLSVLITKVKKAIRLN